MAPERRQQLADISAIRTLSFEGQELPKPAGPGHEWSLDELLTLVQRELRDRNYARGKTMFSAAQCISCHRFQGEGSSVGPDLSAIGQRFTLRDLLDSILHPSKAVSDQYRVAIIMTDDGRTLSGRIVSRDNHQLTLAPELRRPNQTIRIPTAAIEDSSLTPLSTMPEELLTPLNKDEVLDLLAYLVSGGQPEHPVFQDDAAAPR